VPLCGRSLDLVWLAEQGRQVVGCELSPVAVRDFFRQQRLTPKRTTLGALTLWEHGAIRIYCGDFFALTPEHLGTIAAVYDRAALTALPESARSSYVEHLHRLTPENCPVFLLTVEDPEEGETDDRFPEISSEITKLYRARFAIDLAHSERRLETRREADGNPPQCIELRLYRLLPY
jgi:thiopurine S-methyltransferase